MGIRQLAIYAIASSFCVSGALADDVPPIEAYGQLPTISIMALSPSGTRVAFRQRDDENDMIVVLDLKTGRSLAGVSIGDLKPRLLTFLDEDTVFARAEQTTGDINFREDFELSRPYLLDIPSNEAKLIFRHSDDVFDNQTGLGRIVGQSADGKVIFMPAFVTHAATTQPRYGLFHVSTDGKTERQISKGTDDTKDWFVDADGQPLIEVEFNDQLDTLRVFTYVDGERILAHGEESKLPNFFPDAVTEDRKDMIFNLYRVENYSALYHLPIEGGELRGPFMAGEGVSIGGVFVDANRVLLGVSYEGFQPSYKFADEELDARVTSIQQMLRGTAARLVDWTPDFSTLLFHVSGGWSSGGYLIAEKDARPRLIAQTRPDIPSEAVAPTSILQYEARDGLLIPALLTAKKDLLDAGNMPLIVLPHGGPASYDRFDFDWMAQFFAAQGFAVLQPQFRGSEGFGRDFEKAGDGEWGAKMSTDLDDGVDVLIEEKLVDPERVCIIGASYGGYAALAAGAFSNFPYKCIVSISGVSDLYRMLAEEKWADGDSSWVLQYWKNRTGSDKTKLVELKAISPIEFADSFKAPVLLIHGEDDTVVRFNQSSTMHKALKEAGKKVTLIELDGEDHHLSSSETRLAALEAMAKFINKNL